MVRLVGLVGGNKGWVTSTDLVLLVGWFDHCLTLFSLLSIYLVFLL